MKTKLSTGKRWEILFSLTRKKEKARRDYSSQNKCGKVNEDK